MIPKALTVCTEPPAVPARPGPGLPRTDEDKANYTADLRGAYLDCKKTVQATKARREALDAQAAKAKGGFRFPNFFAKKSPNDAAK